MRPLAQILEIAEARDNLVADSADTCPDCRGRGWRLSTDGGAGAAVRCECELKRGPAETRYSLKGAGMARTEVKSAFDPWDESHQTKPTFAREWLTWVLRGAPRDEAPESVYRDGALPSEPWILTLFGLSGRGKTKTSAVLARIYTESGGRDLVWANATRAFDVVQMERKMDGFSAYEAKMLTAGLLVVDDFGLNHRMSERLDATVNHWLYQRHREELPTIIPTNVTDFKQITDSRISSRIAAGVYKTMRAETDFRDCVRLDLVQKGGSKWQE